MVRAISVLAVGALLAGLLAGTAAAETFVGANGDDNSTAGTDAAAGDAMEALVGGDTVDARGGQDLVARGPEDDGGMDGFALFGDFLGHEGHASLDGNGVMRGDPGNGFVFADEPTSPLGGPRAAGQTGRVIVRYASGADVGEARARLLEGVEGTRSLEFLRNANAEVFAVRGSVRVAVRAAEALPGVEYAEESRRGFALFDAGDTLYERGKQWAPKQIDAEGAWGTSRGDIGPGPDVGVLDTGYFRHPDLADKVVSEYDCGNNDGRATRGASTAPTSRA
jgi:hypothetical protein